MPFSWDTTPEEQARLAFSEYGEAALLMMVDKGQGDPESDDGITTEEFAAKYRWDT